MRCEFAPDIQSEIEIQDLFRKNIKEKKNSKKIDKNKNKSKSEDEERSIASLMSIYQGLKEDGDLPSKPTKEKNKSKNKNKKTKSPPNVLTTTKMTQEISSTTTTPTTMTSTTSSTLSIRPTLAKESSEKSTKVLENKS